MPSIIKKYEILKYTDSIRIRGQKIFGINSFNFVQNLPNGEIPAFSKSLFIPVGNNLSLNVKLSRMTLPYYQGKCYSILTNEKIGIKNYIEVINTIKNKKLMSLYEPVKYIINNITDIKNINTIVTDIPELFDSTEFTVEDISKISYGNIPIVDIHNDYILSSIIMNKCTLPSIPSDKKVGIFLFHNLVLASMLGSIYNGYPVSVVKLNMQYRIWKQQVNRWDIESGLSLLPNYLEYENWR